MPFQITKNLKNKPLIVLGLVYSVWYLSLFPGRLSGDTSQAISLIRNGDSTDWWTGIYFQFLRIATFNGSILFVASAITLAVLYLAIFYLICSLPISSTYKSTVTPIIMLSPLAGAFGMNVSHDVFQASSIIILTAIEFRIVDRRFLTSKLDSVVEVILILTILMTHLGLILALFHIIQIARAMKIKAATIISVALVGTYLIGTINVEDSEMKSLVFPMIQDIKCIVQHPDSTVNEEDWDLLSELAPIEEWQTKVICRDQVNLLGALDSLDISAVDTETIVKLYLRIASQNPYLLVYQHLIRASVVLPPPFFQAPDNQIAYDREKWIGFDSNSELQNGPGLLHPSLDLNELKIDVGILKPFEYLALLAVFIVNQASWFWAWAGLWLYPMFVFLFVLGLKNEKSYLTTLLPVLILTLCLILLSPQSSGRYVMGNILIGFTYFVILFRGGLAKLKSKKPILE